MPLDVTPSPGIPTKTRRGPAHNRKLNEKKVKELAALGLNDADIARHQGVSRVAVWKFLDRLSIDQKEMKRYQDNRADVFSNLQGKAIAVQEKALDHLLQDGVFELLEDKAKVSLINSVNNVFGTAYDKERLERGQSTQNVSLIGKMMGEAFGSVHKEGKPAPIEPEKLGS